MEKDIILFEPQHDPALLIDAGEYAYEQGKAAAATEAKLEQQEGTSSDPAAETGSRIAQEKWRQQNETARISSEEARKVAEGSDDSTSQYYESGRCFNERKRQNAETARSTAETARNTAETARNAAEAKREAFEKGGTYTDETGTHTITYANSRQGMEASRAAAESQRETTVTTEVGKVETALTNIERVKKSMTDAFTVYQNEADKMIARAKVAENIGSYTAKQAEWCEAKTNEAIVATNAAEKVNATLSGSTLIVTDRNGVSMSVETKGAKGDPGSDAEVTKANIESALGYTPADKSKLGDTTTLNTTDKTSAVKAINEVNTNLVQLGASAGTMITQLQYDLGDKSQLTTDANNNLVAAINEVDGKTDEFQTELTDLAGSTTRTNIVWDNYKVNWRIVNSTGRWYGETNAGALVPMSAYVGKVVNIQAQAGVATRYALLKNNTITQSGSTPSYCDTFVWATDSAIAAGETKAVTIPNDCNYLYLHLAYQGANKAPQAVYSTTVTGGRVPTLESEMDQAQADILANTAKIDGIVGTGIFATLPKSEFLPKMQAAKKRFYSSTNTTQKLPIVLAHISDIHGNYGNVTRFLQFCEEYASYIDLKVNTGDDVLSNWADDTTGYFNKQGASSILSVLGNHDTRDEASTNWRRYVGLEAYNRFLAPCIASWGVTQPEGAAANGLCYYYKDYTDNLLRIIFVDVMGYDDAQNTWLQGVLADANTNGLHVMIVAHLTSFSTSAEAENAPFIKVDCNYSTKGGLISSSTTSNNYNANAYKMLASVDAFMTAGGTFVGYLQGHAHYDFIARISKYPSQMVYAIGASKAGEMRDYKHVTGTRSQDEFQIVSIDTYLHKVTLYKVGANVDSYGRIKNAAYIDYVNGKVADEDLTDKVGAISTEITELQSNVVKMVSTTYAALKAKRDAGQLVAGMQYRITDYTCTTTQENTQSAGHVFDIIVTADSTDTINENARAIQHAGDTYFADCDLAAWELKYCIDNDTDRFLWADEENGKGVIFYMKDEWNNECPYDFKNIMFLRVIARDEDEWGWVINEDEGEDTYLHTFSAYDYDNDEWKDASMCNGLAPDDGCCSCQNNNIKEYAFDYDKGAESCCLRLNDIVFMNVFSEDDCSYFECRSNTFGNDCRSNTFGNSCYSNTFGNSYYSNTFGNGCSFNTFGNYCSSNTFGNDCYSNTFGNYCNSNTFGNSCYSNTFGNDCYSNTFDNSCNSNTFGNSCSSNTFGNDCSSNTFGNSCYSNTFGNSCYSNTFGEQVQYNKTLKSYIRYVTIENGVQYVNITTSATTSGSYFAQNIHINSGVRGTYNSRKTCSISSTNNAFLTTFGSASDTTINV